MIKENVIFILDGSQMAANVAAAARAMANFGFTRLRLVNPLNLPSAERMARGGAPVVRSAELYTSLEDALKDLTWVAATTGRGAVEEEDLQRPEETTAELAGLSQAGKVGLLFGCEHHGLTNEQIKLCDRITHVPTDAECPSINLAQSVALFAWEMEKVRLGPVKPIEHGMPTHQKRRQLYQKLDEMLTVVKILPEGRKKVLGAGVRRFFARQPLNNKDLSFLLRAFNLFNKHLRRGEPGKEKDEKADE
jgi:TrmH family RNA methyltransferase